MVRELDLKIVWKKYTNLSQGPPSLGSLPSGLHSAPVPVHSSFTSGDLAQGGGLCMDGLAYIWREGQVQKSHSSCAQGLTFDMGFLCFFRGIWKRLCWVLEASGASGGRGRSEFEQRGLRGGSRVSWPASSRRPDSWEGFCFIWLVFLARVHF